MELHDDDKPVGRVLTRRELLKLLGGSGIVLAVGGTFSQIVQAQTSTPSPTSTPLPIPACVVRPELTEGPYFVDGQLNRSDIRIDPADESVKDGTPLKIIFRVSDMTGGMCAPLKGAQVDIWHCDAEGVYSGVAGEGTANEMWLRGYQVTDEGGIAEFITIYPGWYPGRAVHIHFKIRTTPEDARGYEFVSQLFFPEDITNLVYEKPPYIGADVRYTLNENDNIFRNSDDLLTLEVSEGDIELIDEDADEDAEPVLLKGYIAVFDIGLDLG